jgi:Zn-dependent membrane protease YugP
MLYLLAFGIAAYFFIWVIMLAADAYVELVTIPRWKRKENGSALTGSQVAEHLLKAHELEVEIEIQAQRTRDAYDVRTSKILLCPDTANMKSMAAMISAAQMVAQAQQHRESYQPALWGSILSRPLRIAFIAAFVILFAASAARSVMLLYVAGVVVAVYPIFLLVVIPAAFDANRRARAMLQGVEWLRPMDIHALSALMNAAVVQYLVRLMGRLQDWSSPTPTPGTDLHKSP